jgi:hypothetical protein
MDNRAFKSPLHYLGRALAAMAVGGLVWAATFLPLGSELTTTAYYGAGAFFLVWLYCAYATVQMLRSSIYYWRKRRSAST